MLHVVPLEQPTVIDCVWDDLEVEVSLQPRHQIPGNTFTTSGGDSLAIPMEPSQWQHGVTETEIAVHGLVDPRVPEPSLTTSSHQRPSDNWPAMWVFTFDLLDAVLWKLRVRTEASGKWIPSPNDLGPLTWNLECGGGTIDSLIQDPPGLTPSWFTQFKQLDDHVELAESCEKILSEYSNIYKHRINVFHGTWRYRVGVS